MINIQVFFNTRYVARNVDKCKKVETEEDILRKRLEREKKLVHASQLQIDYKNERNILGEGAFGKVYQGKYLTLPEARAYAADPKSVNLQSKEFVACKAVNDVSQNTEIPNWKYQAWNYKIQSCRRWYSILF